MCILLLVVALSPIQSLNMQALGQSLQRIRPAIAAARSYSSATKEVTSSPLGSVAVFLSSLWYWEYKASYCSPRTST